MLPKFIRLLVAAALVITACPILSARAQEENTVKAIDLRNSPQRYWAQFFVFSDTLRAKPSLSSESIDGRNVFPLETAVAGTIYAEYEAAKTLSSLSEGEEHMFYATVTQRKGAFFDLLPFGRDFVVIVKSVGVLQQQIRGGATPDAAASEAIAPDEPVAAMSPEEAARHDAILGILDQVMKDVQKDMYGFAESQGIELSEVMSKEQYRDRVGASIRTAVRKIEDQNRTTGYEFLINIIWAIMADQHAGEVPATEIFVPEAEPAPAPATLEAVPENPEQTYIEDVQPPEEFDVLTEQSIAEPVAESVVENASTEAIADEATVVVNEPAVEVAPSGEAPAKAALPYLDEAPVAAEPETMAAEAAIEPVAEDAATDVVEETIVETTEAVEMVAEPVVEAIEAVGIIEESSVIETTPVAEEVVPEGTVVDVVTESDLAQPFEEAVEAVSEIVVDSTEAVIEEPSVETLAAPDAVVEREPVVEPVVEATEPVEPEATATIPEPVPENLYENVAPLAEEPATESAAAIETTDPILENIPSATPAYEPPTSGEEPAPEVQEPAPAKRVVIPLMMDAPIPRKSK